MTTDTMVVKPQDQDRRWSIKTNSAICIFQ